MTKLSCDTNRDIVRKGYWRTSSKGKRYYVKPSCIRSTRSPKHWGEKRQVWEKQVLAKEKRSHNIARKKYGSQRCKKGEILRQGYVRQDKAIVAPVCIKDRGAKGKGSPVIGPLEKGTLAKFGYHAKSNMEHRHYALGKAVQRLGPLPVFRKLNSVYVLNKRTNPKISLLFKRDRDWVKQMYMND